jgi:hypothetical protein
MADADYAGAVAAIEAKFVDEWKTGDPPAARTRIAVPNKTPDAPWPPRNESNALQPWVLFSVEGADAGFYAGGTPGNQLYLHEGLIYVHVYVPVGNGTAVAFQLAVLAGEIFRNQNFYNDNPKGSFVRTWAPRIDGGGPGSDDKTWFRVTATIPFGYMHRG